MSPTSGPASPSPAHALKALDYRVLQQCMHCGLCLPSCPTYAESGRERNSPRGRIALMRAVADDRLPLSADFRDEMNACVGCLACTSACPAGVDYGHLIETARAAAESEPPVPPGWRRTLLRAVTLRGLFRHPRLLRLCGRLLWAWRASGSQALVRRSGLTRLLPARLQGLERLTPRVARRFSPDLIAEEEPALGPRRYRVALLTGCAQDLIYPDVNRATADVLRANGCEVVTPRLQPCCGSLHAHQGDPATARELARRLLDLIDPFRVDAIISNAAGCGSHLKHYHRLLADDAAYADRAAAWSQRVYDISEWLGKIGLRPPRVPDAPALSVTYHEACHLCHAQKISREPRELLAAVPGLQLRELHEATWCCGSAGVYSLTHAATANALRERKLGHIRQTAAAVVAVANPGCLLHLEAGLREAGDTTTRLCHPVSLLADAYAREAAGGT